MIAAESRTIIESMRALGVRVGVFGREVYIETASDAMFRTIAKHYGAKVSVVVSTFGKVVAADSCEFDRDGLVFKVQGPARRPTVRDWHEHRKNGEAA